MSVLDDEYEVGYKKPPKGSQFKKGRSGNPKGRPKGAKNTLSLAEKIFNETISIRESGDEKEVTKIEGTLMRLIQKALEGDIKAADKVIKLSKEIDKRHDKYEDITDYIHRRILDSLKRARSNPDVLAMLEGLNDHKQGDWL